MKLALSNPCCNNWAIHWASRASVLRPGTCLMCLAFTKMTLNSLSKMLNMGLQYTPPPMLQIGGGIIKRSGKGGGADAKDNAELLSVHLDPFDQRANNLAARLKISLV